MGRPVKSARCIWHDDKTPSFGISEKKENTTGAALPVAGKAMKSTSSRRR